MSWGCSGGLPVLPACPGLPTVLTGEGEEGPKGPREDPTHSVKGMAPELGVGALPTASPVCGTEGGS